MKSDIRNDIHNIFAVELEYKPQESVRTGVLRAEVEKHKISVLGL